MRRRTPPPPDPEIAALAARAPVGVRRFEYGRSAGWFARLHRKAKGVLLQKLFSDGIYGGPESALDAAIAWHAAMFRKLGPGRRDAGPGGVYRVQKWIVDRKNGEPYWHDRFEARLIYQGAQYCRSFSCKLYGVQEAKDMAWKVLGDWRRQVTRGEVPQRTPPRAQARRRSRWRARRRG